LLPALNMSRFQKYRLCRSSTLLFRSKQLAAMETCGTPGCITNPAMILSTGFFEARAISLQKSSAVALP